MAKKKALLVGIDDYAPVGPGGPDLHGCVADAADMGQTLIALGVIPAIPGAVRALTNARATRANIISGIKWLIDGAAAGDVLVFYYSGHGTRVVDTSGDEVDHWDECICPHDIYTAGPIKDDDIRALLRGVSPNVNLDVILDSCYSGTGTRDMLGLAPDHTARYIDPPLDHSIYLDNNPRLEPRGIMRAGDKQLVPVAGLNHVLWAACKDNQTSSEGPIEGGPTRGVFTYCFCKTLRRAGLGISRARLEALVCAYVARLGYGQTPQLEGTAPSLAQNVFT